MGAVMNCVFGYKRLPSKPEPRYWPAALKTRMNSVESNAEEEATEELSLSFSASASSSSESLSATSLESGESSPSKTNSLFPWKLRHGPRKKRT